MKQYSSPSIKKILIFIWFVFAYPAMANAENLPAPVTTTIKNNTEFPLYINDIPKSGVDLSQAKFPIQPGQQTSLVVTEETQSLRSPLRLYVKNKEQPTAFSSLGLYFYKVDNRFAWISVWPGDSSFGELFCYDADGEIDTQIDSSITISINHRFNDLRDYYRGKVNMTIHNKTNITFRPETQVSEGLVIWDNNNLIKPGEIRHLELYKTDGPHLGIFISFFDAKCSSYCIPQVMFDATLGESRFGDIPTLWGDPAKPDMPYYSVLSKYEWDGNGEIDLNMDILIGNQQW